MTAASLREARDDVGETTSAALSAYMIIRLNFAGGYGYAPISETGAQRIFNGYLVIVLPERQRDSYTFFAGEGIGLGKL